MPLFLLSIFLALLIGSGLGIFLSVYNYPQGILIFYSNFIVITLSVATIIVILLLYSLVKGKKFLLGAFSLILVLYLSFNYAFIISKKRIDKLVSTPPTSFLSGYVKVSFLNKVLVQSSNYNVWVYLRNYDSEFSRLGINVIVIGRPRHFYSYLTNRNFLSYTLYLLKDDVPFVLYSDENSLVDSYGEENILLKLANDLRQNIFSTFESRLPLTFWLSSSLIIGESSEMSKEFSEEVRKAGLAHIFSVSGFHVGVIVGVLVILFNLFRLPRVVQFFVGTLFLIIYSIIVGLKPPVVRASILASIVLLMRSFSFKPNYLNITSVTGIAMLLLNPFLSVDVGFILSFVALISIILFSRYITDAISIFLNSVFKFEMGNISKSVVTLFSVSFVATVFTLPIVLMWFGKSSIVGILSSIVMVPLSSLNITSGMLSYVSYVLSPSVGELLFRATNLFNVVFILLTNYFSSLPLEISANLGILTFAIGIPIYYYLAFLVIIRLPRITSLLRTHLI
jgi:ComEC/Rec2-related protein